ncbi:MAG: hypothetical protein IJG87_03775 [Ruminococcus sp.]|nr:hypothetical protein [Ruminococcus sp.]
MKKIIKNRVYDTDAAKLIAAVKNDRYIGPDRKPLEELLYQKKNGEFFLFRPNLAESNAAHNLGISSCPHDKENHIFALTYEQARKWGELEMPADDWLAIFGEPEEDDSKAQIHVNLSKAAIAKLKQAAQKDGQTVSAYIENWINTI